MCYWYNTTKETQREGDVGAIYTKTGADTKIEPDAAMRQSLECLQLSALDLLQYVQETALENPMLEVEIPSLSSVSLDSQVAHETTITEHETWDDCFARRKEPNAEQDAFNTLSSAEESSLRDHLLAQLGRQR